MNDLTAAADSRLTGRHVALLFVAGFSIIIAVNLALAFNAVRTFPGVETPNVYATSQRFDADRAAQDALGWDVGLAHREDRLILSVVGTDDLPVRPGVLSATLGRATTTASDVTPAFAWDGKALVAPVTLRPGNWNLRLELEAVDGTVFRRRIPFRVAP
ncbi:MAG: FixH family protein [Pseudomonadota bacterium]